MKDNGTSPKSWSHIQCDLQNALTAWADLSQSSQGKLNPDQEQFQKIKKLIQEITNQLDAFSNDIQGT